jgi:protein-S-isoprenylcysteine O-methyltransferase Ste14
MQHKTWEEPVGDIGQINENSFFYRVVVKYRVALGFLFGALFPLLTIPNKYVCLSKLTMLNRYTILAGLPFAVLGECIRTWSSGVIVKNRELATEGPYALVRNPLYVGSFIMGLGIAVMSGSPILLALVAVLFPIVYGGLIRKEEKYLLGVYGQSFLDYCERVPRFVPTFKHWPPPPATYDIGRVIRKHKEWRAWLALYLAVIYLVMLVEWK